MSKRVLVIGSGAREHTLAWKLAQSPQVSQVLVAPGNGGTAADGGSIIANVDIAATDVDRLLAFALENALDLTVVGPEAPLELGLVDRFQAAGLRCFGATRVAAQLETSKVFAKEFMRQMDIPTAPFAVFNEYEPALAYARAANRPLVIKADGLAAGKGVIVCDGPAQAEQALSDILRARVFGGAGDRVIVEECLSGPEVSLLAFCDGKTVTPMPSAQDHKRIFDGGQGPNTGGMGAYAPTPFFTPEQAQEAARAILQVAVDGMAAQGAPYVGVLYAGLMLTPQGLKVLEFNCRFGDPEAQVILPLLESDLVDVIDACLDGRLNEYNLRLRAGAAATVVAAAPGYPSSYPKGLPIHGVDEAAALPGAQVFHAGTKRRGQELVTDGGRVLAVTGVGDDLRQALDRAYQGIARIHFDGMHYRKDIGTKAMCDAPARRVAHRTSQVRRTYTYKDAGVDIEAGNRAVELMKDAVQATYTPAVLAGIGAFGGLLDADALKAMDAPVLVASTDSVGTKVKVAARLGRLDTIGADLVNHCVNDILVQGARPLFFLDYVAVSKLIPEMAATMVTGVANACRAVNCVLLGGETAELPGVYAEGEFDLVGAIVGVVERSRIVDGRAVEAGDALIGLGSAGLHTNGYSLARRVLADLDWTTPHESLGAGLTIGDALLAVHRCYLPHVERVWAAGITIKAMAHITGGGLVDNLPRSLPAGLGARINLGAWPVPPIFDLIRRVGNVPDDDAFRALNMGIGMVLVVAPGDTLQTLAALGAEAYPIGRVAPCAQCGAGARVKIE